MAITERYTIKLTARDDAEKRAAETAKRVMDDSVLIDNAKKRNGNVKMEKWWSVVSGMLLVATFILYTFYLTIPAVILLGVLVAFLIYAGISLRMQRKVKENAEHEISPSSSMDAFIKTALGMEVTGRNATAYMDKTEIAAFGKALRSALEAAGAGDVEAVNTTVKVTEAESDTDGMSFIPAVIILTSGETEVVLDYNAPFAIAATGDCVPADGCPAVGEPVKSEIKKRG